MLSTFTSTNSWKGQKQYQFVFLNSLSHRFATWERMATGNWTVLINLSAHKIVIVIFLPPSSTLKINWRDILYFEKASFLKPQKKLSQRFLELRMVFEDVNVFCRKFCEKNCCKPHFFV